jgi:5-methylcytosine-specific restriction endonuclease McrA
MSRCINTENLEVHHKRRDGGNDIENAQILCQSCHENTSTYGMEGKSPPEFSTKTKEGALIRAENRCECEKEGCHMSDEEIKLIKQSAKQSQW